MKVTIRHGTVRVPNENGSVRRYFRGDTVELDDAEATALLESGAVVPAGEPVPTIGTVFDTETGEASINAESSDEEIIAWLQSANTVETMTFISQQSDENPEFVGRIGTLLQKVIDTRTGQPVVLVPETITLDEPDGDDGDDEDEDTGGQTELDDLDPEEWTEPTVVVTFGLEKISAYLKNFPDQAQDVLAAEYDRAATSGGEPRKGIERLVEALAGSSD